MRGDEKYPQRKKNKQGSKIRTRATKKKKLMLPEEHVELAMNLFFIFVVV